MSTEDFKKAVAKEIAEARAKKLKDKSLELICAPIFDAPMGARLALMRKMNLWDQKELGLRLGISAQTVSEIESGKLSIPRFAFTMAKLRDVFGDTTHFILYGTNPERFNAAAINQKFFKAKFHTERKPREHWTVRALREGHPRRQK